MTMLVFYKWKLTHMQYPAIIAHLPAGSGGRKRFTVSVRNIPEATGHGATKDEAVTDAKQRLSEVLRARAAAGEPIPEPSGHKDGEMSIEVPITIAASLLMIQEMARRKISSAELARIMGTTRQEISRMTSLSHTTKIDRVHEVLKAIGVELELQAREIQLVPVFKNALDGKPTFRRYEVSPDGSSVANRKIGDVRRYSDEILMPAQDHPDGPQELMLIGKGRRRKASECV